MPRLAPAHASVIAIFAVAVAACAPAAPALPTTAATPARTGTPAASTPTPSTSTASPTASASLPAATAAVTPKPTQGSAQVDLTFTGARQFTAQGAGGRCTFGTSASGGAPRFGYEGTEADFPGLGLSFSLIEFGGFNGTPAPNPFVDLKWVIDDNNAYGQSGPVYTAGPNTITLSADHHTVTLDAQLSGLAPQGKPVPGPEHVTGTIACP